MFTLMPSELSCLHPLMPSRVVGSFTTTCLCQLAYSRPSRSIPSKSVESTSTLTGPFTISQISLMSGLLFCLFSFAISEGLVVTPSKIPRAAASRISLMLAVSIKNFMARPFVLYPWGADTADSTPRPTRKPCGRKSTLVASVWAYFFRIGFVLSRGARSQSSGEGSHDRESVRKHRSHSPAKCSPTHLVGCSSQFETYD